MNVPATYRSNKRSTAGEGLAPEQLLLKRAADVRLCLAIANLALILLDHTIPIRSTLGAYVAALGMGLVYLLYAIAYLCVIRCDRANSSRFFIINTSIEILIIGGLIISTDGYLSPFHYCLIFVVINSGFSQNRRLPLLAAMLAVLLLTLIALIPQERPPDWVVYAVRTGYLLGAAMMMSLLNSFLLDQTRYLAALESAARHLSAATTRAEVPEIMLGTLSMTLLGITAASWQSGPEPAIRTVLKASQSRFLRQWELRVDATSAATLTLQTTRPLTRAAELYVGTLCERAEAALLRISLTERLVEAAVTQERLKIADRIHDTSLQNLAAADLFIEQARQRRMQGDSSNPVDLLGLRDLIRGTATELRQDIMTALADGTRAETAPDTDSSMKRSLPPHGRGTVEFCADQIRLNSHEWQAVMGLIREGISNGYKHARAQSIRVEMHQQAGGVTCRVSSVGGEGVSFPVAPGYGLRRSRMLVEAAGGQFMFGTDSRGQGVLEAVFGRSPSNTCSVAESPALVISNAKSFVRVITAARLAVGGPPVLQGSNSSRPLLRLPVAPLIPTSSARPE